MLTKLRFKNWRSLKNVKIDDLGPLTIFIGANSSGKTNIIDGLRFIQECTKERPIQAIENRGGVDKIRTANTDPNELIEVEFSFNPYADIWSPITYALGLRFNLDNPFPDVAELLVDDHDNVFIQADADRKDAWYRDRMFETRPLEDIPGWSQTVLAATSAILSHPYRLTHPYITQRWQLLDENFMPPLSMAFGQTGDIFVIDRCADNLPTILNFLYRGAPKLYQQMEEDLQILLGHLDKLKVLSDDRETRFYIEEKDNPNQEAPTISAGTARIVAMLTAYYALDLEPRAKMPGLLVIEEPDTALNPGILRVFVDLLRRYVSREGYPRQIILTTHNPYFLDFFEHNEVRVVERDREGYTHVNRIDPVVWDIWKDQYTLGQVWLTNTFGGLPL